MNALISNSHWSGSQNVLAFRSGGLKQCLQQRGNSGLLYMKKNNKAHLKNTWRVGSGISTRQVNTVSATKRYQSLFCVVANVSTILCSDLLSCSPAGTEPEQSDLYIATLHGGKYFLLYLAWAESKRAFDAGETQFAEDSTRGKRLDLTLNASFRKRRRKKKLRFGTILRGRRSQLKSECRPCSQTHHDEETLKKRGDGWGYWRKVSHEEQDSFLPPPHPTPTHPLTLPCDKLSQQVLHSAGPPGEMTARLSEA